MNIIIYTFITLSSLFIYGQKNLLKKELQKHTCIYKRPVIFGASISAGYANKYDAYKGVFAAYWNDNVFSWKPVGSRLDPVSYLAKQHLKKPEISIFAEVVTEMTHTGYLLSQFLSNRLNNRNKQRIENATMIASLDGYYWPAVHRRCSFLKEDNYLGINKLIEFTSKRNIVLLLGTVPEEDPNKVDNFLKTNGWHAPNLYCLKKINRKLKKSCTLSNNCYLLDLHKFTFDLNNAKAIKGKVRKIRDIRFDGIHLTKLGRNLVAEAIEDLFIKNPPKCRIK